MSNATKTYLEIRIRGRYFYVAFRGENYGKTSALYTLLRVTFGYVERALTERLLLLLLLFQTCLRKLL